MLVELAGFKTFFATSLLHSVVFLEASYIILDHIKADDVVKLMLDAVNLSAVAKLYKAAHRLLAAFSNKPWLAIFTCKI